jgi:tetratricopeptide (TPR) repeat protein
MTLRATLVMTLCLAAVGCAHGAAPARDPGDFGARPLTHTQQLAIAAAAEQVGDGLRAQQYLLAALRSGASAQRVLPWLLRLYVADGQYRLAIATARDHLRVHAGDTQLRLLLASLYEAAQQEELAVAQYERTIVDAPSDPRAHFALASLLRERGREPGRADQHFRAYLALAPRGADAAEARAALLTELP